MANFFFSELGCQKYWRGNLAPPWSFSNPFGPLESPKCLLFEFTGRARPSHTCLERLDHHWTEVGPKNGKRFFFKTGLPEVRGGNLAPPWGFSNPFGPLESLRCLLFEYAWLC